MNEIKSVKISGQGYAVDYGDGTIWYVSVDGCGYDKVLAWIKEGNTPEPEFTEEEIASIKLAKEIAELKTAKNLALGSITVEVSGNSFDGNELARSNMTSAIISAEVIGATESPWKLADNSVAVVPIGELKLALALSIQEVGRIVMTTSKEEL